MGWIGSLVPLGAFIFCLVTGKICDVLGRKTTLLLITLPYLLGWVLVIWSRSLLMLYLGRCFTGIAAGATSIASPLYINEIAEKDIRGTLGSYFQLMVTVGILYSYLFGKYLSMTNYTFACAAVPLVFFVLFSFQPETPMHYLQKKQNLKAKASLYRLRGSKYDVDGELLDMESTLQNQSEVSASSLLSRRVVKGLTITLGLMFFQQFCGINAVIFYTSQIFKETQVKIDPQVASIIIGVVQVVATFISSLIVDRTGRKVLLICSLFVIGVSSLLLGLFFTLKHREDTLASLACLPIASLCVYIIAFSLGLGPIPWIIPSEIFATNIKGVACSLAGSLNFFLAFLITKFFLDIETEVGDDTSFYFFAVVSFLGALFVMFILPETKGKTIEQIEFELDH